MLQGWVAGHHNVHNWKTILLNIQQLYQVLGYRPQLFKSQRWLAFHKRQVTGGLITISKDELCSGPPD